MRASFVRWLIVLAALLGVMAASAGAGADAEPSRPLLIDEPRSALHFEVEGGCLAHPDAPDSGGPLCPELASVTGKSDVSAVVRGAGSGIVYMVSVIVDRQAGTGETRARRVAGAFGDTLAEPPAVVTYGDAKFVRARVASKGGTAICFVTADDRPEVAAIVFVMPPDAAADVESRIEAVMRSVRRGPGGASAAASTVDSKPMTCGSRALVSAILVLVIGLPVFSLIGRAIWLGRRVTRGRPAHDDAGGSATEGGAQLVGEKCAACKRSIVADRDATACPKCSAPAHKERCLAEHDASEHA